MEQVGVGGSRSASGLRRVLGRFRGRGCSGSLAVRSQVPLRLRAAVAENQLSMSMLPDVNLLFLIVM